MPYFSKGISSFNLIHGHLCRKRNLFFQVVDHFFPQCKLFMVGFFSCRDSGTCGFGRSKDESDGSIMVRSLLNTPSTTISWVISKLIPSYNASIPVVVCIGIIPRFRFISFAVSISTFIPPSSQRGQLIEGFFPCVAGWKQEHFYKWQIRP